MALYKNRVANGVFPKYVLVKASAVTRRVEQVAVDDDPSVITGVALLASFEVGQSVYVQEIPGVEAPILSDGFSAINPGDKLVPSPSRPGRVRVGATSVIGVAMTSCGTETDADLIMLFRGVSAGASGDSLPSQTGNAGKFLMTDGADLSWEAVTADAQFDTMADLIAALAPTDGTVCLLKGYYAQWDGGEGSLFYDAASTATHNAGNVVKPSSVSGAGRWLRDVSDGTFNVLHFGARSTNAGENFDSLFAFNAAMDAMGPTPYAYTDASYTGQKLVIPPSPGGYQDTFYYLSNEFRVKRNCQIVGVAPTGGSVGGGTKLKFPLGKRGVVFMSYLDGTGERADGATISNCQVFSTFPGDVATTAVWRASHAYLLNDIIVPRYSPNRYGYAYKCTTAGTSGSSEPAFPGQILGGAVDPGPYDAATYADGSVVWTAVQLHGIDVRSNFVQIENCYVHHWPGNGISCHGATGASTYNTATADIAQIHGGSVRYCGGSGVHFAGHDGNAGYITGVSSTQNIGWGFRDDSVLGQLFQSCHSDNNARGSYAVGRAMDCYSEGGVLQYAQGMHWIGGIPGRFSNDYQKTWTALDATITAGDTRVPTTPNGYQFVALSTGTTGASEPTWKTDPISQVVDGSVTWYCIGEYTPTEGQSSIDLYGLHSPMTFKDHASSVIKEFYAGYPQNAGALWGWRRADDLYTMQPGPGMQVLTWGNSPFGDTNYPNHPFYLTEADDDGDIFADGVGAGRLGVTWPLFLGSPYGSSRIKIYVDTVPPSDVSSVWKNEYWGRGSFVFNKTADGSILGWVCTVAGKPGTWVAVNAGAPTDHVKFSEVTMLDQGYGSATLGVSDYTYGNGILILKAGLQITGARFYWPGGAGAQTVTVKLWDAGGSVLKSQTASVNAAGVYVVTWASPYTVLASDVGMVMKLSMRDGVHYPTGNATTFSAAVIAPSGSINNISAGPYYMKSFSNYAVGDAFPNTGDSGTMTPIEPVITG